jgi:hypothetical protein
LTYYDRRDRQQNTIRLEAEDELADLISVCEEGVEFYGKQAESIE